MDMPLTSPIPVTGIIEVQNSLCDRLCVNASGQNAWSVQVIRGGRRSGRNSMTILCCDASDVVALKTAVDEFLEENYSRFQESKAENPLRRWIIFQVAGTALFMLLGLTFLAFMISVFLKLNL
jgi:hypothetical protein